MAIPIQKVCTDSFTMEYFRFGTGEKTFVILPGLSIQSVMGAAEAVAKEYSVFSDEYTVYVFDRRAELPAYYPVREMARDTAKSIQALGLENIFLFGASQGGMIALVIAIEYPELVRKMVLGSTSANIQEEQFKTLRKWIDLAAARDSEGLYLDFGKDIYPPTVFEQYRDLLAQAGRTVVNGELDRFIILAEGIRGFNVVEELDRIRCPVLAIGDFEDQLLDADATMEIAEKLDEKRDFRLYMYMGYGHAAFDTAPDYRDRMYRFFAE